MPMDVKETAIEIHKKVWDLFDYTSDKRNYDKMEDWRSHAKAVNAGERFKDDCDGFALTCCELLIEAGVPREEVKMIVCQAETEGWHAICGVDAEGTTWILDNRYKKVYDYNHKPGYKYHHFMRMSHPGKWQKVTND